MIEHLKKTLKHTVLYGLGGVIAKAVGFLLIPVYTRYLTPSDFGVVALVMVYFAILEILMRFGVNSALFRVYFNEPDEDARRRLVHTCFLFQFLASGVLFLILFPLSGNLSRLFFGNAEYTIFFQYATAGQALILIRTVPRSVMRAKERPVVFTLLNMGYFLLFMGFNILFIVVLKEGPLGVIKARFWGGVLMAPIMLIIYARNMKPRFRKDYLKEVMRFGLPLVPEGLASWILSLADRYILRLLAPVTRYVLVNPKTLGELAAKGGIAVAGALGTLHAVGVYDLANKFSLIIKMGLVSPFIIAWGPLMFAVHKKPEAKQVYRAVLTLFSLVGVGLAFALGVMAPEVCKVMATWPFYEAWPAVFILSLAHVCYGIYLVFTVGTSVVGKTKYQAYSAAIGAGLNIILNLLLIPRWGMMGASVATLLSYASMAVIHYNFAQRLYRIDYNLRFVLRIVLIAVVLWLASTFLPFGWIGFPLRLGIIGLFVLALKLTGSFKVPDIKLVIDEIKARFLGAKNADQDKDQADDDNVSVTD